MDHAVTLTAMQGQLDTWLRALGGRGADLPARAASLRPPLHPEALGAAVRVERLSRQILHAHAMPSGAELEGLDRDFALLETHLHRRLVAAADRPRVLPALEQEHARNRAAWLTPSRPAPPPQRERPVRQDSSGPALPAHYFEELPRPRGGLTWRWAAGMGLLTLAAVLLVRLLPG